ncbi:serine/threonine protein kinase [Mycoplasma phocoeninasale]|uniref:mitogen-activated protein kinase kinase n=1 Tax=Mycoplasma phocoeninasale TaxID=2726117 RepID=A0A858U553_9MOLU|nr:serine/threonine-protein kinase [Mycoplasma phocoeninasale]QJG66353.1 serine/threonine protein kinase [Mycoplasma phocoeninasale]
MIKKELNNYPHLNSLFTDFQLIGQGGFGQVYSATYKKDNNRYSIKILSVEANQTESSRMRFINECKVLKKIHSRHVVKILMFHISTEESFYVMELINGEGLKNIIRKNQKLLPDIAVLYAKEICQGLIDIHKQNIIHRDLKPSNILIENGTNNVKLIDFGISLDEETIRVTAANKTIGSVQYIAPEILTQAQGPSIHSDMYALGIIMYEMLVGKVPFTDQEPQNIMLKQINSPLPKIEKTNITIPQALENIIIKCTAKKISQRYENCKELLLDLESCLDPKRADEKRLELTANLSKKGFKNFFRSKLFTILFFSIGGLIILITIIVLGLWAGEVI